MMRFRTLFAGLLLAPVPCALMAQLRASEVSVPAGADSLHGTLLVPANATVPMSVALIIAGSGPTDRDGNSPLIPGKNNSLRMVAEELASVGIASLRYDKRGVAGSARAAVAESEMRFSQMVDDAVAWIEWLRKDPRFVHVTVIGHSEGSLVGIMATERAKVDRLISLAGAGRPAAVVLDEQLARSMGGSYLSDARRILHELKSGRTVDSIPRYFTTLFRPSVQPYLISWLNLDPAVEVSKLKVPIIVVQGTTDLQVSVEDARRLAAANALAELHVIDGMNHVLKEVRDPAKQTASYGDPALLLHPGLAELLRKL